MLFRIKEDEILVLVEEFLKSQNLVTALRALEKESNVVLGNLDEDALFLRELVMDGEWQTVLEYLNPLREAPAYQTVRLMIEKQRYLELLATEKGSYDAGAVMKSLSVLEEMCRTRHEYTALCYLLTRPHLNQHPAYSTWSHYQSRLECFNTLYAALFQKRDSSTQSSPSAGRLVDLLTKGLFYESALNLCSQKLAPGGCISITDALTDKLLECTIEDKEAILLHWLYEIPTSALVMPTNKKIVQVELQKSEAPAPTRRSEPLVAQSVSLQKRSTPLPDICASIDRTLHPLNSTLPPTLLPENGLEEDVRDTAEKTLGDSEVAMEQVTEPTTDYVLPPPAEKVEKKKKEEESEEKKEEILEKNSTPSQLKDSNYCDNGSKSEQHIFVPSLLEIEMGFKPVQLVDSKDMETQQQEPVAKPQFNSTPDLLMTHTRNQEEKIKQLQQQLNELRIQQDSLRMGAALEKAGKVPTHPKLEDPHEISKPLYIHPQDLELEKAEMRTKGVSSPITHSTTTDRGTNSENRKPTTTAVSNGWLEAPSSLHTLESFSEDSLRPSKTSTPNKPMKTPASYKTADSSMLKVKFAPTAVLEDVQPIRAAAFHPAGELIAIGSNSKALRVCSCHMLSDSVQTLVREDGCQDLPVLFKRNRHHRGSVYTVAWNKSGNLLATGSNDKSVIVVGFDADNCISTGTDREFSFHKGTVRDIHFHEDSSMMSVGGGDNLLHLTDVEKGTEVSAYSGHTDTIHSVTSHNDTMITGSADATIRLWDRRSNACTRVIGAALGTQGTSGVTSVSLNNFGNLLCASRDDGLCLLYDIELGKLLAAFSPHTATTCRSVQFYRNPRYILSGSYDGTIALTCAEQVLLNPELPCTEILGTHRDKVTNVMWHPTKQAFATCSADRTVCLWTAKDGIAD